VRVQNVRDFPQTRLDCEINAPLLSNEHGDPRLFQVFAKNSLIKNPFEEEKSLLVFYSCLVREARKILFFNKEKINLISYNLVMIFYLKANILSY